MPIRMFYISKRSSLFRFGNNSYPADVFERFDSELALKGVEVVSRVRLVLKIKRFFSNFLFTVRRRKDAADALHRRGTAVAGHDAAPDDALDLRPDVVKLFASVIYDFS
jgi:hypothetical protein